MESSVLDQLRLQEGRLFQSEGVLALYLDVKAVMNETIVNASNRESLESLNEEFLGSLESTLKVLAPKGVPEYHNQSLNECVKMVARLLWPSEHLLVAKPLMITLLKGLCKRITSNENFAHYRALDPIKQDYVIREAFRRTLVNDCLIVFPSEPVDHHESVSQGFQEDGSVDSFERPIGAQSAIGPKEPQGPQGPQGHQGPQGPKGPQQDHKNEDEKDDVTEANEGPSIAKSVARSVAAPVAAESRVASVAPTVARSVARSEARSVAQSVAQSVARSAAIGFNGAALGANGAALGANAKQLQSNLNQLGSAVLIDMDAKSVAKSVAKTVATSVPIAEPFDRNHVQSREPSVAPSLARGSLLSEMPKVTSAPECQKSLRSNMSATSTNTTSTLRRPLNVRKILLDTIEQ